MRRDARVLLAQAPSGGIARVRKNLLACRITLFVQAHEAAFGHVNLTTHLKARTKAAICHMRQARRGNGTRHIGDCTDICRNILARRAIATRGRTDELGIAIGKRHAQAVNLELAGIGNRIGLARIKRRVGTSQPLVKLVQIHRVIHGIHARRVCHRRELLAHIASHALCVRVGRHKLGMLCFQVEQLLQMAVELRVRHLRRVEGVVLICRMIKDAAQFCRARPQAQTRIPSRRGLRGRLIKIEIAKQRHLTGLGLGHGSSSHTELPLSQSACTHGPYSAKYLVRNRAGQQIAARPKTASAVKADSGAVASPVEGIVLT